MMKDKLFSLIVNGAAPIEEINGCTVDELRKLLKSASSMISRGNDLKKVEKAQSIQAVINSRLHELEGSTAAALWQTEKPEDLEYSEILKAIKSAQWYKHTYGPAAQKQWQAIVAAGPSHKLFDKASRNLSKAPALYEKALADEAFWTERKMSYSGKKPSDKVAEIRAMVAELEAKPKRTKVDDAKLELLKSLLG